MRCMLIVDSLRFMGLLHELSAIDTLQLRAGGRTAYEAANVSSNHEKSSSA